MRALRQAVLLLGAAAMILGGVTPAGAVDPFSVLIYVENSNGSAPDPADIQFNAHITARPADVITQASTSQDVVDAAGDTLILLNLADFTQWAADEMLQVDITNTANGESGTLTVQITPPDPQSAGTVTLVPGYGSLSGTVTYGGRAPRPDLHRRVQLAPVRRC